MKDKNGYDIKVGDLLVCVYFNQSKGEYCLEHCKNLVKLYIKLLKLSWKL